MEEMPNRQHHTKIVLSYIKHLICTYQIMEKRSVDVSAGLVAAMVQLFAKTGKSGVSQARDAAEDSDWVKKLGNLYNIPESKDNYKHPNMAWCPVSRCEIRKKDGKFAHIVPLYLGHDLTSMLYGGDDKANISWDVRNGIWLHRRVEDALDSGHIIIVPTDAESDPAAATNDLKIVILDQKSLDDANSAALKNEQPTFDWSDVDGRTLDFNGVAHHPARRFLFFQTIFAMRTNEKYHSANIERQKSITDKLGAFGTPGSWEHQGILMALVR